MAGSAPLGDGRPASGPTSDGPSRTRPLPRLAGALLSGAISGEGRPPRPASTTSAPKKRRSTFVAPTRPAAPRSVGVIPRQETYLDAGVHPGGVRPPQVPDAALAPSSFLRRQLFEAPPPSPLLPAPSHEAHQRGSVFTSAGRKASTPSFSEPARLPSHQAKNTSMEVAATASDIRRPTSTTSLLDYSDYSSSSSMPMYDWSPTPTADNTMQDLQDPMGSQSMLRKLSLSCDLLDVF